MEGNEIRIKQRKGKVHIMKEKYKQNKTLIKEKQM